ncbi:hypothetical protein PIB30_024732 [Stylosanthes scabra]|uniref:Uncharacterized protein n=1 Tax=Stylosanthes scabra TaxID=79078 RepID=A0ABU6SAJ4_9FABA|nr:hypothetical protein [Stylosanthes scabra]
MDMIRTQFLGKEEYKANVSFFGNPNIVLGSWLQMPSYEADFGLGKPHYFGPSAMAHMQNFIKLFWDNL